MEPDHDAALAFLEEFEGCALVAYPDTDGWAIGFGHRHDVKEGDTCTLEQARAWLNEDLAATYFQVGRALSMKALAEISDAQFTAFCLFAFNVRDWKQSPQMERINACDWNAAAGHWLEYDHVVVNGVKTESQGLLRRRKAELALFTGSTP